MVCSPYAAFRFCCPTGCVYFSDTFNRDDDTDLGADWTETAGDWSIDTNRLKIAATADAKCTCNTTHPTASTKYIVSVSVTLGTDGDVARVWVDDSAAFAELERITSTRGRLRLYDGATCKGSVVVALGGYTRLVLCTEASKIHVGTGGAPMLTIPATATSSVVAVGTGACTGTVYFEDFSLSKHQVDDATCPSCGDEGCTWYNDTGQTSVAFAAVDATYTGTWDRLGYADHPLRCTADGTLTIATVHPLPSGASRVVWRFDNGTSPNTGAVFSVAVGGSGTVEFTAGYSGFTFGYYARIKKAGVQYGPTVFCTAFGKYHSVCWDGSYLSAEVNKPGPESTGTHVGSVADTVASVSVTLAVSSLTTGSVAIGYFHLQKHPGDIAACKSCGSPSCVACSTGTFANHATVTIAGITSNAYGCTCTDQTIDLYATASGCQWTGTKTGPCSSGTWTATATITAVTGGYKLTVTLTTSSGAGATWENTVLSGSPVDCLTAFDGDVPWVSASGSGNCTFGSATCTFATP